MARRINNSELITIYWRDIPAQVNAQRGRERQQVVLTDKFQRAIDRAKRKAGIVTSHEDVAQWRRVSRPCGEDLAAEAQAAAEALIAGYTIEHLGRLAYVGGFEPRPDEVVPLDVSLEDLEELDENEVSSPDADTSADPSVAPVDRPPDGTTHTTPLSIEVPST